MALLGIPIPVAPERFENMGGGAGTCPDVWMGPDDYVLTVEETLYDLTFHNDLHLSQR